MSKLHVLIQNHHHIASVFYFFMPRNNWKSENFYHEPTIWSFEQVTLNVTKFQPTKDSTFLTTTKYDDDEKTTHLILMD